MHHGGEAVIQFGDVRAAFVLIVLFAELNADFAGRGGVDRRGREGGGADGIAGIVGFATAAVPPPAERQFGDARVVLQDQLRVVTRDLAFLLPLVLGPTAALPLVPAEGFAAVGDPVVVPVSLRDAQQHVATVGVTRGVAGGHRHERLTVRVLALNGPLSPERRGSFPPAAGASSGVARLQCRLLHQSRSVVEILLHVGRLCFNDHSTRDRAQAVHGTGLQLNASCRFLGFHEGPCGPASSVCGTLAALAALHNLQVSIFLGSVPGEAAPRAERLLPRLLAVLLLFDGDPFTQRHLRVPETQLAGLSFGQRFGLCPPPTTPQLDFTQRRLGLGF